MFQIKERGSRWSREILAGVTVFFSVSYILFLIPPLLQRAGMPLEEGATLIALVSALGALMMGLFANRPFILAPGMGMAAYFVFGGVFSYQLPWESVITAAFISSACILVFTLVGLRDFLVDAFPKSVKLAAMTGVGLFLTLIGFQNAGLTVASPATMITLGSVTSPTVLITFFGIILTGALMVRRLPAAILLGIVASGLLSLVLGMWQMPTQPFQMPTFPTLNFSHLRFEALAESAVWGVIVGFFFLNLLDSAGTFCALGRLGGLTDEDNRVFGSTSTYIWDSAGGMVSCGAGLSPSTTFVESAVALQVGGRTGLTAIVAGLMFIGALFAIPLLAAIPAVATAPALIVTGAMMMRGIADMDWTDIEDNIPAFLTLASMAFTFNIAHGIAFGIVAHTLIYALSGKFREIPMTTLILTIVLILYLATYL